MWFIENIGSIIVVTMLLGVVSLLIVGKIKERKKGKGSSCGCGCSNCSLNGVCHNNESKEEN